MKIDDLATIIPHGETPNNPRMVIYHPKGRKLGKAFSLMMGMARNIWLDRTSTLDFEERFRIPDQTAGKARNVVVSASIGLSEDGASIENMIETLEGGKALHDVIVNEIETILTKHVNSCSPAEIKKDPVFPARARCRQSIQTKLGEFGLRLDSTVQVVVEPHINVTNHLMEIDEFLVTPLRGMGRIPIRLSVTLNAPSKEAELVDVLAWYFNETPVVGDGQTVESTVCTALQCELDNRFTAQQFRRDVGRIVKEVEPKLKAEIADLHGLQLTLNIFEDVHPTETYHYNGVISVGTDLLGTGRNAKFDIEYTLDADDEEKFERAFDADKGRAGRLNPANGAMSAKLQAANEGRIDAWARALVAEVVQTELQKALSEVELDKLPAVGILPEDASVRQDSRINELIVPIFERFGATVTIRTAPVVDARLHRLKNGISIETDMKKFDLAATSLQPELKFVFEVYLPDSLNSKALNSYFQANQNQADPLAHLKDTLSDRINNVAAKLLVGMQTDEYLDQTGDRSPLREDIEDRFSQVLEQEFGLALRPPLAMQKRPDQVEERYDQMRHAMRDSKISVPTQSNHTGAEVEVNLSLQYQVDRLQNPNLHGSDGESSRFASWEQFRNMALNYKTLGEHLEAFESVISASVRGRLQGTPTEAYARTNLDRLRTKITEGFEAAGEHFGLRIRVFPDTLDVNVDGGIIGDDPQLIRKRNLIARMERRLAELEEQYVDVAYQIDDKQKPLIRIGDDTGPDEGETEATIKKTMDRLHSDLDKERKEYSSLQKEVRKSLPGALGPDTEPDNSI